ncbi:hypothetical protein PXJ20_00505 [Paraburkholderia sp. A1RI_3L]|uniref:hypothetical protein n=1 Tax=Paraburkholderia TaxID=1822464 RepID=UPI003B78E93B
MKTKLKMLAARGAALTAAGAASVAHAGVAAAAGPDFSTLTSGIDFSTVTTGILAVAATLITVYVAIKGAKILMSMVRGG